MKHPSSRRRLSLHQCVDPIHPSHDVVFFIQNSFSIVTSAHNRLVSGLPNFRAAFSNEGGVRDDTSFPLNYASADINASFPAPLIPLLIKDTSHPNTTTH